MLNCRSIESEEDCAAKRQRVFEFLRDQAAERVELFESKKRRDPLIDRDASSDEEWEKWIQSDDIVGGKINSIENSNDPSCTQYAAVTVASRRHRRDRKVTGTDPIRVIDNYLDMDGFPKICLASVSLAHRQIIYGFCGERNWDAPVEIRFNEKGRAVYAAKDLRKYDFICGKNFAMSKNSFFVV